MTSHPLRKLLADPDRMLDAIADLDEGELTRLCAALLDEQRRRAIEDGDQDAVIAEGFEVGFGRDGLGTLPWIRGPYIVCPGGLVGKNRGSHRCRFISVDESWVWESSDLVHEEKRSSPGRDEGFRAVALVPVVEGMTLDVVSGKLRQGQHAVDRVISFEVRDGDLVELSQRVVRAQASHGY